MTLLDRVRGRGPADPTTVSRRDVDGVLVLHTGRRPDRGTVDAARALPADPAHTVVLLDVPRPDWARLGPALAGEPGRAGTGLRLVPVDGEPVAGLGPEAAAALRRTVVVADGPLRTAPDGGRVVTGPVGRWWRCLPQRPPEAVGRRFPTRPWESGATDTPAVLGEGLVVEPLPAGVWIHHDRRDDAENAHRVVLRSGVVPLDDVLTCVLGAPGGDPVPAAAVAAWFSGVPAAHRGLVRVGSFGPSPDTADLAALLGAPLAGWVGLPLAGPRGPEVRVPRPAGALDGWRPWVAALGHEPDPAAAPVTLAGRAPWRGAGTDATRIGEDAVVEPVATGVWLRPDTVEPGTATRVRALAAEPAGPRLVVGGSDGASADRLGTLAAGVVARLDTPVTGQVRAVDLLPAATADPATAALPVAAPAPPAATLPVVAPAPPPELPALPAIAVVGGPPAVVPGVAAEPGTAPARAVAGPSAVVGTAPPTPAPVPAGPAAGPPPLAAPSAPDPRAARLVRQRPPVAAASITTAGRDLAKERAWLRRALGERYDTAAAVVTRVLSENPGLRGGRRAGDAELLADLVALRVHLDDDRAARARLAAALHSGRPGPHTPFAREVAAGLDRMPTARGPVGLVVDDAGPEAVLDAYAGTEAVVEHGLVLAGPAGSAVPGPDEVAVLVVATTTRRLRVLDPEGPDRVGAAPGVRYRVLAVHRDRRTVWLREAPEREPADAVPRLDAAAVAALEAVTAAPGPEPVRGSAPGLAPDRAPGLAPDRGGVAP